MIELTLKKCRGEDYCASEDEIANYFRGKYFGFLTNSIRFDSTKWGEESIVKESSLAWIPISTQAQTEIPFKVTRSLLSLKDLFFDLEDITTFESSGLFRLVQSPNKPFEYNEEDIQSISVQLSIDLAMIEREIITTLDVLSDIGGLESTLVLLFGAILSVINHNALRNYMIAHLYQAAVPKGRLSKFKRT